VAIGVLTTGVIGAAAVLTTGMQNLSSSPQDVIAAQKAQQAIEAVYAARDSHKLTWAQVRNVVGAGSDAGVFLDGPQPLRTAGPDGLVNTADDDPGVETLQFPGPDQILGTADDVFVALNGFTREIYIRDVASEGGNLRTVTVTVKYQNGPATRTFVLSTLISSYS
jgi:type II secretory pathway pseudopilin PulG